VFEKQLEADFKEIFGVKKVTYDQPGSSQEQENLFIEVDESRNSFSDKKEKARVTGKAIMFGNNEKLTFGFFSKAIAQADPNLTKKFFFFDFEANTKRYQNIVQRGFSFIYFYDGEYDPDTGNIDSIDYTLEES